MIPHEMKAAYYMGRENIEIRTVPVPQIHDHDVLIQNICSSICGTDSAVFMKGPNTGHKIDIGSEFVGIVGANPYFPVFPFNPEFDGFVPADIKENNPRTEPDTPTHCKIGDGPANFDVADFIFGME